MVPHSPLNSAALRPTTCEAPASARTPAPCAACDARALNICGQVDEAVQCLLAGIMTRHEIEGGTPIFEEGQPADSVMNITAGTARLYKLLGDGRRQILGFRFAGDFMGLSHGATYAYSAESVSAVQLCRFPRRRLEALRAQQPQLDRGLLDLAMDELGAAQEQLLLLGRKTAEERLVSFLLSLSRAQRRRREPADPVVLTMGRADIADYLGLTIETVSRTFGSLRKKGLIALPDALHVRVLSADRMEDIASGLE